MVDDAFPTFRGVGQPGSPGSDGASPYRTIFRQRPLIQLRIHPRDPILTNFPSTSTRGRAVRSE
jgi:hypothetical protein